jgi:hypothetical protein
MNDQKNGGHRKLRDFSVSNLRSYSAFNGRKQTTRISRNLPGHKLRVPQTQHRISNKTARPNKHIFVAVSLAKEADEIIVKHMS